MGPDSIENLFGPSEHQRERAGDDHSLTRHHRIERLLVPTKTALMQTDTQPRGTSMQSQAAKPLFQGAIKFLLISGDCLSRRDVAVFPEPFLARHYLNLSVSCQPIELRNFFANGILRIFHRYEFVAADVGNAKFVIF